MSGVPVLGLLVLVPILGAGALALVRDVPRARAVAIGFALLTLGLCVAVALALLRAPSAGLVEIGAQIPGLGARWHLGVDGLAAPFLPLAASLACAVLVAAPREEMTRPAMAALLLSLAMTLGVYCSLDLLLLTAFWIASLVPGSIQMHRARSDDVRLRLARTYDVFLVLGSLPIVAATLAIAWWRTHAGAALPFDLEGGAPITGPTQQVVFLLLVLALLIRKAIVPFHSWLPALVERGPIGIATMIVGTHVGAFLVARLAIPLTPQAAREDLPVLAVLALGSSLYSAFVAIAQTDLRRALGFVLTSQLAMVLVGLCEVSLDSVHGAMLQMLALGLTSCGLLSIAAAIEARTGTSDVTRFGGLGRRFPVMAAAFLLLALCAVGLPGTLQFVAEDLLLHGLLDRHPIVSSLLLCVTVLNGVTLLLLFFRLFYGPARDTRLLGPGVLDLLPREAVVVFSLVLAVIAAGVAPAALITVRHDAVRHLALEDLPPPAPR